MVLLFCIALAASFLPVLTCFSDTGSISRSPSTMHSALFTSRQLSTADFASAGPLQHRQIAEDLAPWTITGISAASVRRTLARNVPSRDGAALHALTIVGGALVFNLDDLAAEPDSGLLDKLALWAEQLNSVFASWPPLPASPPPELTFLLTASSLPYLVDAPPASDTLNRLAWARRTAPVFSITKRTGDGDVLMPNPYFGDLTAWDAEASRLLRLGARRKRAHWVNRVAKLHWRGSCSARFEGMLPRLRVLLAWAHQPGFDIAFSNACLSRLWAPSHPERVMSAEQLRATASLHKRRAEPDEMSRFKYLLHLPGASTGSYSRSLQLQLTAGAALLKLDNPYREFYYSSLLPGVHYLPVNESSIGEALAWLVDHDEEADAMGTAASEFAAAVLSGERIRDYWVSLLRTYAALQRFSVALPERACVCPGRGREVRAVALVAWPQLAKLPRCTSIPRC